MIKVLVVDDSAFIRVLLTEILDSDPDISVVASASDPIDARSKIKKYNPDVITLDIEMPKMDGLTFLRKIMRLRPMPVVMFSTLTQKGADITFEALKIGAVDFVPKPAVDIKNNLDSLRSELIEKVKCAAVSNIGIKDSTAHQSTSPIDLPESSKKVDLIAIGASTGGTEAILAVIRRMPTNCPPIVMAQHIPDVFSTSFAKRLNEEVALHAKEVRDSTVLEPGNAYLAPGHMHMVVKKRGGQLWVKMDDSPPVNRHKPSVDMLFKSISQIDGVNCLAAILTGMGKDGAEGLLELKQKGAFTIAQDERTSVVWGMPGAAVGMGAVKAVLPLQEIAPNLVKRLGGR
ncbi:chemotaxis response regulator protein-glutamate methylesterase [Aliikangiella marina]|uniref:Protein-glutamate methylesterase/protein-glutamine glutaminase n=1 Tax=Aliikangiella marina TaxID=1712262 RepID=A0A545TEQ1_9GAMM|nr:chemotaxis response regulator protein-glutamate methylesterase [Aliikangiella marina]